MSALPPPTCGCDASRPSGVISTRSLTMMWSVGATEAGNFEQVLRWLRNFPITLEGRSAALEAVASKSSGLPAEFGGAADRSSGRPSIT